MLETWLNDAKAWAAKPYREEGTLIDWVLFIGIWVVAGFLWSKVVRRLVD